MNTSQKYPRSLHVPISLGTTSDDRFLPSGYLAAFAQMEDLVLTEKLDGQNNCLNKHGVFARSHVSPSVHPWDKPLRERWALIRHTLGDLEIFGENMYGVHSIAYRQLESYFYVFAIRVKDFWLPWEEVQFYAELLDFPTVPTVDIHTPLSEYSATKSKNEDQKFNAWLTEQLGMTWEAYVEMPGQLEGYDPKTRKACCEGFVLRNAAGFYTNNNTLPVASNEFDNLAKLVRAKHVKTDVHWTKTWQPAQLIDYHKYGWVAYQYLSV